MKTSKFTDSQIMSILKQAESGTPVATLCREHGMSNATFYKWCAKYGGMDTSLMARLKELEAENTRLKKMYAEERLKAEIIQEAMTMHSLLNSSLNSLRKIPIGALVCASRIYGMLRVAAGITSGFTAFTVSWH